MLFYQQVLVYIANLFVSLSLYLVLKDQAIIIIYYYYFMLFLYYLLIISYYLSVMFDIFVIILQTNTMGSSMHGSLSLCIGYGIFYIILIYVVLFFYGSHIHVLTYKLQQLTLLQNHQNYFIFFYLFILYNLSISISTLISILITHAHDLTYAHIYVFVYDIIVRIIFLSYVVLHIGLFLFDIDLIIFLLSIFRSICLIIMLMFFIINHVRVVFIRICDIDLLLLIPI